jgi:hypothetical protein
MRLDQLRGLLQARPFRPFTVHLPEGRTVDVVHHDFALLSPDGRTLLAYGPDSSLDIIDLMLITSIRLGPPPEGPNLPVSPIPVSNGPQ